MTVFQSYQRCLAWSAVPLLALCVLLAGCEDGELLPPEPEAGDLFARYVAIGNSITAGFQSSGINANTQRDAYPVLLAQQMGLDVGDTFNIPALNPPGCPPPLTQLFPQPDTLGGPNAPDCALRSVPTPTTINNVAVPNAGVIDALSNTDAASNANALTTFILGGRTQVEAAEQVEPTFASVWIGNNDVLDAALSGAVVEGATYTAPSTFANRYGEMMDRLAATNVEGGVLVGVANATLIPHLSPGVAFFQAKQQGALPPTFDVADTCAPASAGGVGESTLIPFRYSFGFLLPLAQSGTSVTLDCTDNRSLAEIYGPNNVPDAIESYSILTGQEIGTLSATVQAYNDAIESEADDRGWAYVDPNALFAQPDIAAQIPPFPDTDPTNDVPPFGPFFSLDGVHPSSAAHRLVTNQIIAAINETYGTEVPELSTP